jgi:spectinomycin phosphotransferase
VVSIRGAKAPLLNHRDIHLLEKPDIPDQLIISCLQVQYGLRVTELTFLPLGADVNTAVYRVVTYDGTAYFLKLRKGFDEITVSVPLFLKAQGIQAIIIPFETESKKLWADFDDFKMILYPLIEGQDGFDMELTDHHRRSLGAALKGIHTAQVPAALKRLIPKETFSPQWRESVKTFQMQVENNAFDDPTAAKLVEFMNSKRDEITRLVERTEQLTSELQSKPLEFVLCHTDIHGGNILISDKDKLYIVDWDNPILAPKERDLMFIGGGIDEIWKSKREEAVFYEGYRKTEINLSALAYYRYERVIEDLAVICEQLLLTDEGGADRERSYGWFTSNFEPGNTIEIAEKTDKLLTNIT